MRDWIRSVLGIRRERQALPTGRCPRIGEHLVRKDLKIYVTLAIPDRAWEWMQVMGWRLNTYRKDRRKYVQLPANALQKLVDADFNQWTAIHARMVRAARAEVRRNQELLSEEKH